MNVMKRGVIHFDFRTQIMSLCLSNSSFCFKRPVKMTSLSHTVTPAFNALVAVALSLSQEMMKMLSSAFDGSLVRKFPPAQAMISVKNQDYIGKSAKRVHID